MGRVRLVHAVLDAAARDDQRALHVEAHVRRADELVGAVDEPPVDLQLVDHFLLAQVGAGPCLPELHPVGGGVAHELDVVGHVAALDEAHHVSSPDLDPLRGEPGASVVIPHLHLDDPAIHRGRVLACGGAAGADEDHQSRKGEQAEEAGDDGANSNRFGCEHELYGLKWDVRRSERRPLEPSLVAGEEPYRIQSPSPIGKTPSGAVGISSTERSPPSLAGTR